MLSKYINHDKIGMECSCKIKMYYKKFISTNRRCFIHRHLSFIKMSLAVEMIKCADRQKLR